MIKIAMIGAGSTVFAKNLMGDILSYPVLCDSEIALMDIDPVRLRVSGIVAEKVSSALDVHPKISTTLELQEAVDGADYVINMIQVGGYDPCTITDFEIPKKYGLRQTIADTLGVGGIMRALRTYPEVLKICRAMEASCPDSLFINYTNPMAMLCWALNESTSIKTVGLCHSVQGTARQLATDIGEDVADINYVCAGINHMAFYTIFEKDGVDLYPQIRNVVAEGRVPEWNRVRYELFKRFGYFVTESSEHLSEYTPWFIKRAFSEIIEDLNIPLDEYISRCKKQIADWEKMRNEFESDVPLEVKKSQEYGSQIIHAMETGASTVVYGNVPNNGLIENLPSECCVEVPCLVNKNGIQPTKIGRLPHQLAAMIQTNVNVQNLTVQACITGKKEHVYHAALLDPHTASELPMDKICNLIDDLIEAHGTWLPELV